MKKFWLAVLFFPLAMSLYAQCTVKGVILDSMSNKPLVGASISLGSTGVFTNAQGEFTLKLNESEGILAISMVGYGAKNISVSCHSEVLNVLARLQVSNALLSAVTITSDRYEQPLAEVTVSTDLIKPALLESTNATSLDEVLVKIPGVDIIDGQANIRGGSGFSYGAGSRVLLLVDDIPYLQADAGFPHWDDIPVENIGQIEVVKGAGSALYGSSALNGIVNVRTAENTSQPYTKVMTFVNVYGRPGDSISQAWWNEKRPFEQGQSFAHRSMLGKKTGLTIGGYQKVRESYNRTFFEDYNRLSLGLKHQINHQLKTGFNSNYNSGNAGEFFFWKSIDSLYSPAPNTFSNNKFRRFNIDPYLVYIDSNANKHKLLGRYHFVDNQSNNNQSNSSRLLFAEYQYQKHWKKAGIKLTSGAVFTTYATEAALYGDTTFNSQNLATYLQLSKKLGTRLNLSAGFRYEHNTLKAPELFGCEVDPFTGEMICDTVPNGRITDAKPVFRAGANYQAAKATFIRASWGQGYRFPTIAERFVKTTFGGIPISPNPSLVPETGWSAEMGIKQGYKLNKLVGFFDATFFWSKYQNMMEFNLVDIFPTGFQSINVGGTDLNGLELSLAGQGKIGKTEHQFLIGYTHINPKFQEFDPSENAFINPTTEGEKNAYGSSSQENVLKYRFRHTIKADWEMKMGIFSLAGSANYYSFMEAVDAPFEALIVPQLGEFRSRHQNGDWVLGARASATFLDEKLKCSFLANNLLNRMYSLRPGLMEAPRSLGVRVEFRIQ
ncbi:MAG: TonB-dependent receptor [Bacteroidetes bacterium]|nr:TonB-dependent receptor [Bacteroidota bacterium]